MNQAIVDQLFDAMKGAKGIPALEGTISSILNSLRDIKKGNRDVVAHVIEDFSMTQKVLKLANSAMYAPFANGITSISSAMSVLGADAMLHLVLGAAMISAADLQNDEALSKTILASELARNVSTERTEDVSIATLMYDLGALMAGRFLPEEVSAIKRKVGAGATADDAAKEVLGMSFAELGAEVARRWNLPTEIVSIIDGTGDATLVQIARFSNAASSLIHAGEAEAVNSLITQLDVPGIDKSSLGRLVNLKLEQIVPSAGPAREDSVDVRLSKLHVVLVEEKSQSLEDLAGAMFPELSQVLDTTHCLLFMTIKSGDFWIRNGYGKGIDELKSKLRLPAEFKPTAFHAAIKNNADVAIAEVAKLKASALPEGYHSLLPKVSSFVILPIANTKVSGLLYLDWENQHELTKTKMVALRQLRDLFLPLFPR